MTTVKDMFNRFKSFDPTEAAGKCMTENKEKILDVNREQLYEHGEGKDGQPLPKYVSKQYAAKKVKMRGKSIVDGYLSGDMQKDMTLKVENGEYTIFSTVPYTQYFLNKRPTAFGLTEDGKAITWRIIQPGFVEKLKAQTGCK